MTNIMKITSITTTMIITKKLLIVTVLMKLKMRDHLMQLTMLGLKMPIQMKTAILKPEMKIPEVAITVLKIALGRTRVVLTELMVQFQTLLITALELKIIKIRTRQLPTNPIATQMMNLKVTVLRMTKVMKIRHRILMVVPM